MCDLRLLLIFISVVKANVENHTWLDPCLIILMNFFTPCHQKLFIVMESTNKCLMRCCKQCSKDERMSDMFTKGSHRRGISVMYLTQNLFPPGKQSRTISLNSHYMIVFKNPRDSLGISTLACQMFPNNFNYLLESFQDATSKPHGYLLMDLHQLTPENMRLRTNILPHEQQVAYIKRT